MANNVAQILHKLAIPETNELLLELFDILGHIQQMTSDKVHEQSWDKWDSPTLKLIIETLKAVLFEIYVHPYEKKQTISKIQRLREQALGKSTNGTTEVNQ